MNCHSDHKDENGDHKHSPVKHMLHMIICCGLPVIIILSLPFIAGFSPGVAALLGIIAPFICPVMMGGMMFMMFGGSLRRKKKEVVITEKESREL